MSDHAALLEALREAAGVAAVATEPAALKLGAGDLYETGPEPIAVVRPAAAEAVARSIVAATSRGYAVAPRGGGLSYTGGYACAPDRTILIDLSALDRIESISDSDMVVTVEAGVTWKQLYEALAPRGLRAPFFGTFSGAGATIGGGLSHGALFFGSARYGSAAENALALEVATADGTLLRTGQWALRAEAPPVFRGFGPDLTGLFLHDGGAFGIKTRASLRLIRMPAATGYASFAFATLQEAAPALSEIARAGAAEEAYVLDPSTIAAAAEQGRGLRKAIGAIRTVAASAGGAVAAARALAGLARGGRTIAPPGSFTLHCVAAGSSDAAVKADLRTIRRAARRSGGLPIPATLPRMARADPFPGLDAVLGPDGSRWAALNAKVAHSQGVALVDAHRALMASHAAAMTAQGVSVTYLLSALGNHSFSFETVFHWGDHWLPIHAEKVDPARLRSLREPDANPAARAVVAELRSATVSLFRDFGAASNQIGRTYPYLEALDEQPAALMRALEAQLDPEGLMNPGVLGL